MPKKAQNVIVQRIKKRRHVIECQRFVRQQPCLEAVRSGAGGNRTRGHWSYRSLVLDLVSSWRYWKYWDSGITRDSKRAFGIFRTKNSSQWKVLPGNNSLNLIWFIYSIYIRPFLQNVYYPRPEDILSLGFVFYGTPSLYKISVISAVMCTFEVRYSIVFEE